MQARLMKSIVVVSVLALLVATHVAVAGPAAAEGIQQKAGAKVGTARAPSATLQATAKEPDSPQEQPEPRESGATVARSFAELTAKIEPGDTVYVTRQAGERTKAKVQGFDADLETLFFNTDGTSFGLTESELRQLELRYGDSLANGAVIGAIAGSGIFVIAGIACAWVSDCNAAAETFAAAAVFGGIGAGIGVAIDASVKTERLVYVGTTAAARGFALRPVITGTQRGAVVVLRF